MLCILGTMPPPIGGVSIHIMRLVCALKKQQLPYEFVEIRHNGKIQGLIHAFYKNIKNDYSVIHYQLNNWIECWMIYVICAGKKKSFISTVHSFRPEIMGKCSLMFARACTNSEMRLIAPSESIRTKLVKFGFREDKIIIQNTYLSPTEEELAEKIPEEISSFIDSAKKRGGYTILGNAYKLYLDKNNEDVYGLDICIEACKRIDNLYLVFCMPTYDEDYKNTCLESIKEKYLSDRVLLYSHQISLVPLFKKVDLFVRPTTTDSFGISVAEALECGTPALASDVCERAKGTVTFHKGDVDDFCGKICKLMNEEILVDYVRTDCIDFYMELYKC